jgi:glycosyltransferase involved in cell wall biosynthesis
LNGSHPLSAPLISVVIASHRPAYLHDLLTALGDQSMDRSRYEIIAVCDFPLERLAATFSTVVFQFVNDRSISRKRNAGVWASAGDIIAFIDDDCLPAPEWLERGYDHLSRHIEAAAVEGLTTIESGSGAIPALREYRRLERPGFRTNNLFCRKAVFLECGGFDERFTVQREDLDFCFTLLDRGNVIHQNAGCAVLHRIRPGEPWDLLKNCVNRRFDPLLYKKHTRRYREHIRSPFPPSLLLLFCLYLLSALSILLHPTALIACCAVDAVVISALTIRRCARRVPVIIFVTEWVSFFIAPLILFGALLYGSVRFRKLHIL